ncbi:probable E3 ubiquitin- ligase HIP1 [Olea europaea subsp. europaea]|uniref:RING-type E3 ubiquitin transferase n=3 Tax=Olea europaea subsp. europaea TaxID=158383 RepID=A0A8S0SDM2_OLEEU|nr:probable E3 ubiquitin- ligase HIP1 [Olea europaea subsp. europaea]
MAHWSSTQFTGHSHLHPEPFIYCGSVPNFPQPHVQSVIPDPGNVSNFNLYRTPEPHGSSLFYSMTYYNGAQHQHPVSNLNVAVAASTILYYPHIAPLSGISDISVPVNHGAHNQLSHASTHRISSIPTVSYGSNIAYMDGVRGSLNRKNCEEIPVNYQHHNAAVGSSSSVAPTAARPAERDIASMNGPSFQPPELGGNESMTSIVENEFQRSSRNRSNMILPEFVMVNNGSHLIRGSYFPLPVQVPGTFVWTQAPSIPNMHASVDGACVEALSVSIQDYQVTTGSRNASSSHPSIPHGLPNLRNLSLPMQGIGGYNINFPPQGTSSHRILTSSHTNSIPYQAVVSAELLAPVPPTSFQLYPLRRREVILDPNAMLQNLPNMRLLPEDEMAMLNIPGYHEAGGFIDQHRDTSLDVDRMTYEELLVLEEQIGIVGTGLSEEDIQNSLKTRTFSSLATCLNQKKAATVEQQSNFCVICQADFEDQENVGNLNCGHEYHEDCIKKWLLITNSCPICKSTALTTVKKNCK